MKRLRALSIELLHSLFEIPLESKLFYIRVCFGPKMDSIALRSVHFVVLLRNTNLLVDDSDIFENCPVMMMPLRKRYCIGSSSYISNAKLLSWHDHETSEYGMCARVAIHQLAKIIGILPVSKHRQTALQFF